MSALRLINETEITSSVSSVNVTDVFSADFDIYKITSEIIESAVGQAQYTRLRFINSSGSVISASNYDYATLQLSGASAFSELRGVNQSDVTYGYGFTDDTGLANVFYVFNPFSSSSYTFSLAQSSFTSSASYQGNKTISVLKQTNSITGFQFYQSSGSMGSGSIIRTYGLRVDNG